MKPSPPRPVLTHRQKRLLVQGRLMEPDAATRSDRAIARELGVSQPFVGGLRRRLRTDIKRIGLGRGCVPSLNTMPPSAPVESLDKVGPSVREYAPDFATTAQQALNRFHDAHSPLGRVRRVSWSVDDHRDSPSDAFARSESEWGY